MDAAMLAVQLVAMLALDPPAQIAADLRGRLTAGGLNDAAIDRLVDQARAIIAAPSGLARRC